MASLGRFQISFLIAAVVLATVSSASPSDRETGTVKGKGAPEHDLEKNGFEFIGSMPADNRTIGRAIGSNTISLYLSPPNMRFDQITSIRTCRGFMGTLLFILNAAQFEDVRIATLGLDESFWTSGVYDDGFGANGDYVWDGLPLAVNSAFIRPERQCTANAIGTGLAIQGALSSYGLCGANIGTALRFICRV